MTDYPSAPVVKATPNRDFPGHYVITVACPYCGRTHSHGSKPGPGGGHGHRVSHCTTRSGALPNVGYMITDPDGLVPRRPINAGGRAA